MFHLRDGFYFGRMADGSVQIVIRESGHIDAPVCRLLTVPENEWVSVLAAVCARGETSETYQEACDYHGCLP
jgi:hypothetical protein